MGSNQPAGMSAHATRPSQPRPSWRLCERMAAGLAAGLSGRMGGGDIRCRLDRRDKPSAPSPTEGTHVRNLDRHPGSRLFGYSCASGATAVHAATAEPRIRPGDFNVFRSAELSVQPVEHEIDHRGRVEGEHLRNDQSADDGNPERALQF